MKVITLVGNVTRDAEVRTTQSGDSVCAFALAVNDRRANQTYFFECSYWGKGGTNVAPYITKGKQVTVSGDFSWREYNGKQYLQVRVNDLALGKGGQEQSSGDYDRPTTPPSPSAGGLDDDIPF